MEFRILGPLDVLAGGRPVLPAGGRQRALLAFLLLHVNEPVSTDRLLEELWREGPRPGTAKTLHVTVSRLRKALGGAASPVVTHDHGYTLRLDPERIDAHRFERLAEEGGRALAAGESARGEALLEEALALWRGPPLADVAYEPFAQQAIARLEELRAGVHEQLVEARLAVGRHAEVIGPLEALIAEHPYRERLRGQLMLALYRSDRQAEALQAYQDARHRLVEELGIEPGQRLRDLEAAILAQDPALLLAEPAPAEAPAEASAPSAATGPAGRGVSAAPDLPTGVVTFLLTDVEGSSALWEAQPAAMEEALERHDALVAEVAAAHGGRLLKAKGEGDSTFTVFPRASAAVRAAAALQEGIASTRWPAGAALRVRVALHTGEAQERDGDFYGPAVNRAARLRSLAAGGEVVLSRATADIVRERMPAGTELVDLGERALRGLARPEHVFRLRAAPPSAGAQRKTVTVLFAGLAAPPGGDADPEVRRRATVAALEEMQAVLERHGATVEAYPGDALMAVFGVPVVHEDDAARAVRGAAEIREAVSGGVARAGISTGEVLAERTSAGATLTTGDPVTTAKRLEAVAGAGEVLVDERTHRLVRDAVDVQRTAAGIRVTGVRESRGLRVTRHDAPLLGRERPLATLTLAHEGAVAERCCHLVTVLGSAGVGKSRLVEEALNAFGGDPLVLRGRCLPYGEGITYWPVAELVRDLVGSDADPAEALAAALPGEPHAARIAADVAAALGEAPSSSAEAIARAVRRLLEALARHRPVVVVLDDLHWAEPTFLDLVEHVADLTSDAPLLLVCMARTELLDRRAGWGGGRRTATTIHLEPLPAAITERLAATLLEDAGVPRSPAAPADGSGAAPRSLAARVAAASEGNPLFAEELVAMLAGDDSAVAAEDALPVPPSIHALVAARLEQLPDDERALLTRVSVEGAAFHRGAMHALAPAALAGDVDRCLARLERRDVIRPDRSSFADDDAFRFRHMLIRDAAYGSLPKATRAELHERFADWLTDTARDRVAEFEEIVGYHLESAAGLLTQLGEPAADPAARAAERLASAGRRALGRGDRRAAIGLLDRAIALRGDDAATRAPLLPVLGGALFEAGELPRAAQVLTEAAAVAAAAGDEVAAAHADVQRVFLALQLNDGAGVAEADAVVGRVIPVFTRAGDELGLCSAWRLRGWRHWIEAHAEAAAEAWRPAADHAARAGSQHDHIEMVAWLASSLFFGPTPAAEGIRRCAELAEEAGDSPEAEAGLLEPLAGLHAMCGHIDEARALVARRDALLHELGLGLHSAVSHHTAMVELLAGDPAAAEAHLRTGLATLEAMGDTALVSTTEAMLGQALLALGRHEQAAEHANASRDRASPDDLVTEALWRQVRARSLAACGKRGAEAETLAREAVAILERTDFLSYQADALLDLARVLRESGRTHGVEELLAEAIRRYERKGNVVAAARAAEHLAPRPRV